MLTNIIYVVIYSDDLISIHFVSFEAGKCYFESINVVTLL